MLSVGAMRSFASLIALPLMAASPPTASVEIDFSGLRNANGVIHACLTQSSAHFPDCRSDPSALTRTIPASAGKVEFTGVPPGRYAMSAIHDENGNRKLDLFLGMPREGFGFTQNPRVRFGPPKFEKSSIELSPGFSRANVRIQYLL